MTPLATATNTKPAEPVPPPAEGQLSARERFWTYTAAISSASVTLLAFLIPSIQAQWDRYEARQVIEQYVEFGDECFQGERFDVAEQAYQKAFELSLQTRLDIDMKRLHARVGRMSMLPEWGVKPPDDLEDVDFQLLLHLQKGPAHQKERAITIISYASFLAGSSKVKEAEAVLRAGIAEDPQNARLVLNLGNLQDQQGQTDAALASYRQAISLDPKSSVAHYNLGVLFAELGRDEEAKRSFAESLRLQPSPDTQLHYDQVVERLKQKTPKAAQQPQ